MSTIKPEVRVALDGAVLRITLSNPQRYNAMTKAMWLTLASVMADLNTWPDARAVLIRGEGDEAFSSGGDISEFVEDLGSVEKAKLGEAGVLAALAAVQACPLPTVACIHGICMGGGLALALACDLRYATRSARFRLPPARVGLGYGWPAVQRMVEVIGSALTAELLLTARTFAGDEAERIGIVHRAHEAAELDAAVESTLATLALLAPLTLHAAKLAIRHAAADPKVGGVDAVNRAVDACFNSHDYQEGCRAFIEKRSPRFTGR